MLQESLDSLDFFEAELTKNEPQYFDNHPKVDDLISKLHREPPNFCKLDDYNVLFSYLIENREENSADLVQYIFKKIRASECN